MPLLAADGEQAPRRGAAQSGGRWRTCPLPRQPQEVTTGAGAASLTASPATICQTPGDNPPPSFMLFLPRPVMPHDEPRSPAVTMILVACWPPPAGSSRKGYSQTATAAFIGSRFHAGHFLLLLPLHAWFAGSRPSGSACCAPPAAAPCSGPACCSGSPPSARAMRSAAAPSS